MDLTKAFDSLLRWPMKVIAKYGCLDTLIDMVKQDLRSLSTHKQSEAKLWFVPYPFSLMSSAMLMDAFQDNSVGVEVCFRVDGN